MDKLRNLSGLTKANAIVIILFAVISFLGQIVTSGTFYALSPYALGLLVGQALTTALNDPELEEPLPLWLRASIGYGVGIVFFVASLILHYFFAGHIKWISK